MTCRLFAVLLSAAILRAAPLAAPAPFTLYVATNGNDGWSRFLAAPIQAGTDGPLATSCRPFTGIASNPHSA